MTGVPQAERHTHRDETAVGSNATVAALRRFVRLGSPDYGPDPLAYARGSPKVAFAALTCVLASSILPETESQQEVVIATRKAAMLMPLDVPRAGEECEIEEVSGHAAWVARLAELGIRQGCRVRVVPTGSPCLLDVGGCKLCLRGGECSQILVRPVS